MAKLEVSVRSHLSRHVRPRGKVEKFHSMEVRAGVDVFPSEDARAVVSAIP